MRLRESERQGVSATSTTCSVSTPGGMVAAGEEPDAGLKIVGPDADQRKNQQRIAGVTRRTESTLSEAVENVQRGRAADYGTRRKTSRSASVLRSNNRPRRSRSCAWC